MRASACALLLIGACTGSGGDELVGHWRQAPALTYEMTLNSDGSYEAWGQRGRWMRELDVLTFSCEQDCNGIRVNRVSIAVADGNLLLQQDLMRGSSEIDAGSRWSYSRTIPREGGSCAYETVGGFIELGADGLGRWAQSNSGCVPSNMGGTHSEGSVSWTSTPYGMLFGNNRYYLVEDAVAPYMWIRDQ